jgi:hypothetical protein
MTNFPVDEFSFKIPFKIRLNVLHVEHRVTPNYAVTGWHRAFRIVDGKHLKARLEPGFVCRVNAK